MCGPWLATFHRTEAGDRPGVGESVNLNTGDVRIVGCRHGRSWRSAGWPGERPTEPWQANTRSSGWDRAGTLRLTTKTRPRVERAMSEAIPAGEAGWGCGGWRRRSGRDGPRIGGGVGTSERRSMVDAGLRAASGRTSPAACRAPWRPVWGLSLGPWRPWRSRGAAACDSRWRRWRWRRVSAPRLAMLLSQAPAAGRATAMATATGTGAGKAGGWGPPRNGINGRARRLRAMLNHRCRAAGA